jgi:hypothetical protein
MFAAFSRKLVSRINQTDIHGMRSTWQWPRPRRSCLPVFTSTCTSYSHCVVAHCWAILFLKKRVTSIRDLFNTHRLEFTLVSPFRTFATSSLAHKGGNRGHHVSHSHVHPQQCNALVKSNYTINLTCFAQLCRNRGYMRKSRSISLLITISQKKNPSKCKPRGKKPWYDTINITYIYSAATWLYISPHVHSRIDFWPEFLAHLMSRLLVINDVLFFFAIKADCIA